MSEHQAGIEWKRESESFAYDDYNRNHNWIFQNGIQLPASAAPQFLGDAGCVDPEEAFVAAISSCHMLTFLAICARKRIIVNRYSDNAVGYMEPNGQGKLAITRVRLRPEIAWEGRPPDPATINRIHHMSHEECFIANSVTTRVVVDQLSCN